MTLEQELELSYYRQVADIDAQHNIFLVQDVRTGKFFVRKQLSVYNAGIYRHLLENPVPNTPALQLVMEDNGILTVIEEYIPGDTLEEYLSQKGTLSQEETLKIVTQLCRILDQFHRRSPAIVNRDIKPSNIKLTPDGTVKLVDLNAAKWCDSQAPKDTVLLGTQGYAAPEQYGFGPSGVLTDIYSVGVLMNVMLTGQFPNQRMADGSLGPIIAKCVELSPSARYQSIPELMDALSQLSARPRGSYALPGFRSRKTGTRILAAIGYLFFFYLSATLLVENAGAAELLANRIVFFCSFFCIILFNGNYLNVQSLFPLTSSKHRLIRWLGLAIADFVFLALWILLLNAIVQNFIR